MYLLERPFFKNSLAGASRLVLMSVPVELSKFNKKYVHVTASWTINGAGSIVIKIPDMKSHTFATPWWQVFELIVRR